MEGTVRGGVRRHWENAIVDKVVDMAEDKVEDENAEKSRDIVAEASVLCIGIIDETPGNPSSREKVFIFRKVWMRFWMTTGSAGASESELGGAACGPTDLC